MRRAFTRLRNGRGGPAVVEIPGDMWNDDVGHFEYEPVLSTRYGPDPVHVKDAVKLLLNAKRPVLYAELPHAQHAFDMYGSPRGHKTAEAVAQFLSWVYAKTRD